MKALNSRKFLYALVALVLVAVPGRFAWDNYTSGQEQADSNYASASELDGQASEAEAVERDPAAFEARSTLVDTAFPSDDATSTLIDELAAEANGSGLIWVAGSPSESVSASNVGGAYDLAISVRADGRTDIATGVSSYLTKVRAQPRLVTVSSVAITGAGPDGTASITATFYYTGGD